MTTSIAVFGNKLLGQNTFFTLFLMNEPQFQYFSDTTAQTGPKQTHSSCSEIIHTNTDTHTHTAPVGLLRTSDSSSQRMLHTKHTTNTRSEQIRLLRESNPRSRESRGRRPTPYTAPSIAEFLTWSLLAVNRRHKQQRKSVADGRTHAGINDSSPSFVKKSNN
jgi:hypothetical protein